MSGTDDELVARAQARLGSVLRGKYRLDRVLGIGGMATVYAATHRNGNEFAVKVLHPELSLRTEIRTRFLREGHAAGSVKHPGAVQVLDDDVAEDGSAFLVMELLQGESTEILWERRQQHFPLKLVVGIGMQLLDVLEAAHARGVIHRDIKPANVFLTRTGHVKVLDFGIARIRDMAASQATQTGMVLGTPAFMAPEQAMANTSDIDEQTDVWAAGATMFTLASGKLVHEGDNAQQIMIRAATTPAQAFSKVFADAPPLIAEVIDRALAFEKGERWGNAAAMREALRSAAKSAFGYSITPEALVSIVEELGEQATVVQSVDLPPPHPGLRLGVLRSPLPPVQGGPLAEVATAQPVSSDTLRRPLRLRRLRSSRDLTIVALGAVAVLGGSVGLFALFAKPSSVPRPYSSSSAAPAAVTLTTASATPLRAPVPTATQSAPAVTASVQEIGIDERPTAAAAPTPAPTPVREIGIDELPTTAPVTPPAPSRRVRKLRIDELPTGAAVTIPAPSPPVTAEASVPTPPTPSAPPNAPACTPPYTFDAQGNRKWKRECLR
jgi:serine/threonine protein kinase